MSFARTVLAASLATLAGVPAGHAAAAPEGTLGLGMQLGSAVVALLAALIAASVVAKLLIVFGVVPRQPETGLHALVHAMANFVGRLNRPRPRRREDLGRDDR